MSKKITKTVDGINVSLDPTIFQEWDVFEAMTDNLNPELSDEDRMIAMRKLITLLFGNNFNHIKKRLRQLHNGKLSVSDVAEFVSKVAVAFSSESKN